MKNLENPVNHSFSSLRDVFESALSMEIDVTKKIHTLMSTARKLEDYNTELCLQWFVNEQMEEEQLCQKISKILISLD